MATKKKKSSAKKRSYRPKAKRAHRKPSPWNVAAAAGAGLTAMSIVSGRRGANNSPIDIMRDNKYSIQDRMQSAVKAAAANAMVVENWYPAIGGAIISAAPRIPVVKIVAKPISNQVKKISHSKAVL